jgi:hypothetical protein
MKISRYLYLFFGALTLEFRAPQTLMFRVSNPNACNPRGLGFILGLESVPCSEVGGNTNPHFGTAYK